MAGHLADSSRLSAIERQARGMSDPVERLLYLRQATAESSHRRPRINWIAVCVLALATMTWRSDALVRRSPAAAKPVAAAPLAPAPKIVPETPNVWPVEQNDDFDLF